MNSKNHEEVRRRRAKATTSRLNLYQKTVLLAGLLTLFLAIGLSPQWAPFIAAGVAGGTLLLFLLFRNLRSRKLEKDVPPPQEMIPGEEEAFEPAPIPSWTEEKISAEPPEAKSEAHRPEEVGESLPQEPEETVPSHQPPIAVKEELKPAGEFSPDGVLAQVQERLSALEEKITRLEDRMADLEEKAAVPHEGSLEGETKIDLQTILAHLDEKEGKVV